MGKIVKNLGVKMGWQADPALGDLGAARMLDDLAAGRIATTIATFDEMRAGKWDDRYFYCYVLAKQAERAVLEAWAVQDAASAAALLARGARTIEWAWEARPFEERDHVSMHRFRERLQMAEADFIRASELDEEDPTPWAFRITVARCLERPADEIEPLFKEATRRHSDSLAAHMLYLWSLSQRWGGTHDRMFEFANRVARRAGEGRELGLMPLYAHIERWLFFDHDKNPVGGSRYLELPQVRKEALEAWQKSLGSRHHHPTRVSIIPRNYAAFWFFMVGDRERVAHEVSFIGKGVTQVPWSFAKEKAISVYERARKFAREGS